MRAENCRDTGLLYEKRREMDALFGRLRISLSYIDGAEDGKALSFSYRSARGEYCVYINKNIDSEARAVCDLREKGRILFNHFVRPKSQKKLFYESFHRNMPLLFFKLPEDKNLNQRLGIYSSYLYERFAGTAQAMEVNSKLFGGDWERVRAVLERNMGGSMKKPEYLSYPDNGWPPGLDWMTYMLLLCGDMRRALAHIGYSGAGGGGNRITTGDIGAFNGEGREEERIREAHETRKTIVDGGAAGGERVRRGRTTGVTGTSALHTVSECNSFEQFAGILRERGASGKRRRLFTDMLYNINRNKYGTDVLIPRRFRVADKRLAAVCVLLDVSGSVPTAFLERVVGAIIRAEGYFNKEKSRLVCWSDSLCSDMPLAGLRKFTAGGGTVLSAGIEYCKRYLDGEAAFFIVSDFQDDLAGWIRAARGITARKTAVGYANGGSGTAERRQDFCEWFSRAGSNADSHGTEVTLKEFSAVFDAVLLRVPQD
ncbi:MAG: VWA domain-containing protein [Spirochaetaceae bacterium]|nr:VWA domain-containing protein [Spirochaetaceae bacterium]